MAPQLSSDQSPDGLVALGGAAAPTPSTDPEVRPPGTDAHERSPAASHPRNGHGSRPETWAAAGALSEERLLSPRREAPRSGWRRLVHRASFGRVNPGPGPLERRERELAARVQALIPAGSVRIAVLSRKGGVGKTTTTLLLGHTFAAWRGDRVVALDANPDAGNLAARIRRENTETVSALLRDREQIVRYADIRGYTSQAASRLEVVAADDDPHLAQALGDRDYLAAVETLDRHYNLILLDTGTGVLQPATQGVLQAADLVVVVAPTAVDRARVSYSTLEWLAHNGYAGLARRAVVAVTEIRGGQGPVDPAQVEAIFARDCAATVRIPWDAHLETGARTSLDDLQPVTRRAYLELAAAVADEFASAASRGGPEVLAHRPRSTP